MKLSTLRLKGQITINNLVVQDDVNKPYDVLKVKRIDANLKEFALFVSTPRFRRNQGYGSGCCSDKKYRRIKSRDFGSEHYQGGRFRQV